MENQNTKPMENENIKSLESLKSRPSMKERDSNFSPAAKEKEKQQPKQEHQHPPQEYESGLEVAPISWDPKGIPLPEVAPRDHVDAKTASTPQVADDPMSWHYNIKKNPGLEVVNGPFSPTNPASTPGGYSSTLYSSQDGAAAYYQQHQQHPPGYHHPPPTSLEEKPGDNGSDSGKRICGMRRKWCYIIMAVAILVLVAAVAVGVGVGIAAKRNNSDSNQSGLNNTGPVESTKTANITCPGSDNSTFSAQDAPGRRFRVICGHDYNSGEGSIDLSSKNATTMANCIDMCAAQTECVGAGWGDYYGNHVCWMKSRLGKPNVSGNWYFAVDLNKTDASTLP